jgi:hypothetical protein
MASKGMTINCISPGTILTPLMQSMMESLTDEQQAERKAGFPLGLGQPSDIANTAMFLLSDGATPKVAIQLRSPHMSTKVGTQMLLKQHGIGYISLWTDYKNQKEYIEKRVKDCLWN